jgi:taurine transport system substrate-binding protein
LDKDQIRAAARVAALTRPFSRRQFLTYVGVMGVGVVGSSQTAGAAGGGTSAAAPSTVFLGNFGSANPQTYAKANETYEKLWKARNASIQWVGVNSGGQVIQTMTAGSMDICNAGSSPMVVGFANGAPISMVYVEKYITDSECLVVRTDRGISSPANLKGKRIGTPFNSSAHFALLAVMQKAGLKPGDAHLINMPPSQIASGWDRGDLDAAYIWQPVVAQLAADKGKILVKTGDLLAGGIIVFDGIVVRDEFKQKHPDLLLSYLKEYDRIAQMYISQPDAVAQTMSKYLQLPLNDAKAYVASFHPITPKEMAEAKWMGAADPKGSGVDKALVAQAQFLKDQGSIPTVASSYGKFIDTSFLQKML